MSQPGYFDIPQEDAKAYLFDMLFELADIAESCGETNVADALRHLVEQARGEEVEGLNGSA